MRFDQQKHGHILKYLRPVTIHIRERYKITQSDLDCLLFLFAQGPYRLSEFRLFESSFPFSIKRHEELVRRGFVIKLRGRTMSSAAHLYDLSYQSKIMVMNMYKMLLGEIEIPMAVKERVHRPYSASHKKNVRKGLIDKINKENRERRLSLE